MTAVPILKRLGRQGDYEIAACRLLLALALFLISIIDPDHVGFVMEPDDLLFLAYLLASIVALAIAQWWWWDYRLLPAFVTMDWLVYLAAPLVDESLENGHLATVLVLAVLILMETSLRWNWRQLCLAALGLNVACWATCFALEWQMGHFDASHAARRISLLLVITGVILAGVWSVRDWGPVLRMPPETPDRDRAFAEALHLAGTRAEGRGAMLCWAGPGDAGCQLVPWGSARPVLLDKGDSCCFRPIVDRSPSLFSIAARHWLYLDPAGNLRTSPMTNAEQAILSRLGTVEGIYLPLENQLGKGSLVIFDMVRMGWSQAWLAIELAHAISRYLDDSLTLMRNQEAVVAEQRQALARDLHDSVAQSLAGARFWLKSFSSPENPETFQTSMSSIASAIDAEILNINTMIARLRRAELDKRQVSLHEEMAEQCRLLSTHWRVDIRLTRMSARLDVPQWLAYELYQMLREAVSNAVRHAGARNIVVLMERIEGHLVCTLENDATRPLPTRTPNPLSLVARARDLGGHLQVMTSKGRVTMEIHLPVGDWT